MGCTGSAACSFFDSSTVFIGVGCTGSAACSFSDSSTVTIGGNCIGSVTCSFFDSSTVFIGAGCTDSAACAFSGFIISSCLSISCACSIFAASSCNFATFFSVGISGVGSFSDSLISFCKSTAFCIVCSCICAASDSIDSSTVFIGIGCTGSAACSFFDSAFSSCNSFSGSATADSSIPLKDRKSSKSILLKLSTRNCMVFQHSLDAYSTEGITPAFAHK